MFYTEDGNINFCLIRFVGKKKKKEFCLKNVSGDNFLTWRMGCMEEILKLKAPQSSGVS